MPKNLNSKWRPLLILVSLIGIGVLLRLWRLSDLFHFTYDEEIIAFVGKRMWVNHHIPLIGGVTPMHFHVPPYFYWLSGIFLFLSRLNPIGWGVAAALIASITMVILYWVGKQHFSTNTGLIAVFLYSFSFYQNIFDRHYWGLVFDGFLALLTLQSLFKIAQGQQKYWYLLVTVLAFGVSVDLSTLTLFVLTFLSFFILRLHISKKVFIMGACIFLLSFLPLIFFDLRHNFSNSRGFIQYWQEVRSEKPKIVHQDLTDIFLFIPQSLGRTLFVFGDTDLAKQYSYCSQHTLTRSRSIPLWMSFGVLCFLVYLFWRIQKAQKKEEKLSLQLILLLLGSTYFGVLFYGFIFKGDLFDHYLATLFPVFLLSVAYGVVQLFQNRKIITTGLLLLFTIANLNLLFTVKHRFGFWDKEKAVKWAIATTGTEDFSLDVISSCFRYNGYRYLFYLYGKEPAKSYVDANFTHLYDKAPAFTYPSYLVVITNPDFEETQEYIREYQSFRKKLITSAQFGQIEVMLIDNSNLDFQGKF